MEAERIQPCGSAAVYPPKEAQYSAQAENELIIIPPEGMLGYGA